MSVFEVLVGGNETCYVERTYKVPAGSYAEAVELLKKSIGDYECGPDESCEVIEFEPTNFSEVTK